MKTRRNSEAQVFRILKEVESGMPVVNVAREHGVSPATIHRWKSKYGGMTLSELKRLKTLRPALLTACQSQKNNRFITVVAFMALESDRVNET